MLWKTNKSGQLKSIQELHLLTLLSCMLQVSNECLLSFVTNGRINCPSQHMHPGADTFTEAIHHIASSYYRNKKVGGRKEEEYS